MKKVAFYTLGCKLNYSETSTIARQFEAKGFQRVDFTDKPDIYIINTCSVTENADKKCKKLVSEAQQISPAAFIAIIGCYAQLKPQEIAAIEGVDVVLGAAEKFMLLDLLPTFEKKPKAEVFCQEVTQADRFESAYSYGDRTRTFLKVQDGCNYHCAFCTIPLARGESRSDSIQSIVAKVEEIVAQTNVKEIVLTGVNTGDFGIQQGRRVERFIDLVKKLDTIEGIKRFRISSIEPNLLSHDIIDFVASSQKFVPHFHIPLQSGSDKVLRAMNRRYTTELYAQRIAHIKQTMPDCCIGVDVIVGFPGETEPDFLETYRFLNELPISYLHVFTYSERANTRALQLEGVVPQAERSRRSKMLHILSDKKKRFFYEQQAGKTFQVLMENDIENGRMHGFTENYVRVALPYDPLLVNEIVPVKLLHLQESLVFQGEEVEKIFAKHF
ncbi:MAG TPA: tRNA (N(6)-L-threonylcarbamoyladenosine(37)-C(2))-methylthiotransferase MtaB [Microscillaceae bacterium]|jgi:threonylcarbamoyladenosine tRNA methylthiotransferase MtaB|nr:tRNA (N(6)-L-threonylcarbamoyladenosine(37)-C(2))-methylthiotransferase MtaB [Microscillaceae bacterium]